MARFYYADPAFEALIDELRRNVTIDDMRDVLRARVQKVIVAQVNSRYL